MKQLLKKPWFTGILVMGLIISTFLINLWIMFLDLSWPFEGQNFMSLQIKQLENDPIYIFGFIMMLVFYLTIVPIILSVVSLFRKNNLGFIITGLVFIGFDISLIIFQLISGYLPLLASILIIINIVLVLFMLILVIIRRKTMNDFEYNKNNDAGSKVDHSKIPLLVLFVEILAVALFLITFVIPLYTSIEPGGNYSAVLINLIFSGDMNIVVIIGFFVEFFVFISIFLYFAESLSNYIVNKKRFMQQSKRFIAVILIALSLFFVAGLAIKITYTILYSMTIISNAAIPMLFMFLLIFIYAILLGKYKDFDQNSFEENKHRVAKGESLIYLIFLTAITVLMLLLPIVRINIASSGYSYSVNLTGFNILMDYASLDVGYRWIAFLLNIMLISIGFCFIISIASFLSKSKMFKSIFRFSTFVNVFFVFIISISGYYFQIAREINKAIVIDIADFYGYHIVNPSALDYTIDTQAIYALLASVLVLIIMFARKTFDKDEMILSEAGLLPSNPSVSNEVEEEINNQDFDPCYSFTELDLKQNIFNQELKKRKTFAAKEETLNGLVNFVVDYARNSRLHLSYTPEDIATFVAGLGASKLSILQGMSGTGKTSLPKIFSEAIFGNCDIVEVESSWKDKNELLGYYNEFSLKYTPKKFTIALYKAALNQEVFTFILLDEMNLSRIEYYFSDFLSLMENEEDQRKIKLVNIKLTRVENGKETEYLALDNGHTLKVPANVWFIGTANRDESTFVISDKVYDRAHTMNFTKRAPKVRKYSEPIPKQFYDYKTMKKLFDSAKAKGDFDGENSDLIKSIEQLLAPYNISFGNRILMQIEDFVNIYKECFANEDVESEAIEKILLSKVVSKLEVKTIEDKEKLEMEFEKLNLHQCAEFIKHLDED